MSELKMARLFVALFPPRQVVEQLVAARTSIQNEVSRPAVRWTPEEQIHVTLEFVGPVDAARALLFAQALGEAVRRHGHFNPKTGIETGDLTQSFGQMRIAPIPIPPFGFNVRATGAGAFPDSKQPRVLWAGVSEETGALVALKAEIDRALAPLGFVPEDRSFHPHLTLGRVNRLDARELTAVSGWLRELETTPFGSWQADCIYLMESVLTPLGARYSVVCQCMLSA